MLLYPKFKIMMKKNILFTVLSLALIFSSCDSFKFDLPEAGSIPDETPPSANFSYSQNVDDWLQVDFVNLSVSATEYAWDFGDGNTSSSSDPSNVYAAEGTYTVTLTVNDALGVTDVMTQEVEVIEVVSDYQPIILEAGFEDLSLPDGTGDGRDSWRNSDLGGVIQITSSPVYAGAQAAKFPSAGDRIAYQLITVERDTDYSLDFYYTMKTDVAGMLTVAVLAGAVDNPDNIASATIASVDLTDQTDASTYVADKVIFNSGDNTEIAIYISNVDVECRVDEVSITKL